MNDLAPIILFVYNRPWHTAQTLEALMANDLADQSILYIYADGAKPNADHLAQRQPKRPQGRPSADPVNAFHWMRSAHPAPLS